MEVAQAYSDAAILVFADFGGGKTTTLERIKAEGAKSWLDRSINRLPVMFFLRDYVLEEDLDKFITDTFYREFGIPIPIQAFWDLISDGQFLLLLDGFDEISMKVDEDKRFEILERLSPLLFGPSPAILTCRPSYFASLSEYKHALQRLRSAAGLDSSGLVTRPRAQKLASQLRPLYRPRNLRFPSDARFLVYALELLTPEQIQTFLDGFDSEFRSIGVEGTQEVLDFIQEVYDLPDLIQRPILLDMVVSTILAGELDITDKRVPIGPADLYEAYTRAKLQLDWDKASSRRSFVTPDQRRLFAMESAWQMYLQSSLELEISVVESVARSAVPKWSGSVEELLTDLRTCSFLTISQLGNLRFVHKSFYEFFVARRLKIAIDRDEYGELARNLSAEIRYFLGAYAYGDVAFQLKLKDLIKLVQSGAARWVGESRSTILANLCGSLLQSQPRIDRLEWTDVEVNDVRNRTLTLVDSSLSAVKLQELKIRSLSFLDCILDLQVESSDCADLWLDRSKGSVRVTAPIESTTVTGSHASLVLRLKPLQGLLSIKVDESSVDLSLEGPDIESVDLILSGSHVELGGSCGELAVTADNSSIDLSRVEYRFGTIKARRSLVRIDVVEKVNVGVDVSSSAVLITGRTERSTEEFDAWQSILRTERSIFRDAVILAYPEVNVGWIGNRYEEDLVLLGGSIVEPLDGVMGITFLRSKARLGRQGDRIQIGGRDGESDEEIKLNIYDGKLLVVEGRGSILDETMEKFRVEIHRIFTSTGFHLPDEIIDTMLALTDHFATDVATLRNMGRTLTERLAELWPRVRQPRILRA